jgi:hypothetical protein
MSDRTKDQKLKVTREDAEMAAAGDEDAWSIVEHEWVTLGSQLEPKPPQESPYWVQGFWSPCERYLVTVCVSDADITVMDDDANIWEQTGPREDMADPGWVRRDAPKARNPFHAMEERLEAAVRPAEKTVEPTPLRAGHIYSPREGTEVCFICGFHKSEHAPEHMPAEKASTPLCGNPVMVNSEWYRGCQLPSGHEGDCKNLPAEAARAYGQAMFEAGKLQQKESGK